MAKPDGTGLRVGVVVSQFNKPITQGLLDGALAALREAGVRSPTVVWVPGALELPLLARRLASNHDAVIALGAVIEGETDHYEHVARETMRGLSEVSLSSGVPLGNGLLTVRQVEHARARSGPGEGNKGAEAAHAALATAQTLRRLDKPPD